MLVVGKPKLIVLDDGIYKEQEVAKYEDNPKAKVYVKEIMITKECFIDAYNKWILNEVKDNGKEETT